MYWLFQSNPEIFRLIDALRAEALESFAITAHKQDIKKGDKVILWQSGKNAGCYALATISSDVEEQDISEAERAFFNRLPEEKMRVRLLVEYNFWNKPISWELLQGNPAFEGFNAGLPGTNFAATEAQYKTIVEIAKQIDVLFEPEIAYVAKELPHLPLNLILYGPPGTGKTYHAVDYALAIIENRTLEELALEDRKRLRQRFEAYASQGQVAFVTFHTSFSYEDFIEGIKPILLDDKLTYQVEDGIFKLICASARQCLIEVLLREEPQQQEKLEFNKLFKAFLDYIKSDSFKYFEAPENQRIFLHQVLKNGDLSLRPAIAFHTYTIEKNKLRKLYQRFPQIEELPQAGAYIEKTMHGTEEDLYIAVFAALKSFEQFYRQQLKESAAMDIQADTATLLLDEITEVSDTVLAKCKKYVLIIDEINRGNISGIFGELMTLLETDKREGRSEALTAVLPYSKTFFSVPPNLYIIGTMNTADRSTENLDLALRRRFAFREMRPSPEVIAKVANQPIVQGVDLAKLLSVINSRIEQLLDREHCIGHAYFLSIDGLEDLKQVFAERILPLLQEYFFNDYAKIGLVLGKDFVREKTSSVAFAEFDHPDTNDFAEKKQYELLNINDLDEGAFIRIYSKG